jgi:hypothetical protein
MITTAIIVIVFLIILINISTLTILRKYYSLFYHSPYHEIFSEIEKFESNNQNEPYIAFIEMQEYILKYQLGRYNIKHKDNIYSYANIKDQVFADFLKFYKVENLLYGSVSGDHPENYAVISDFYPGLEKVKNYCPGNFYHFSSVPDNSFKDTIYYYLNSFEDIPEASFNSYPDSVAYSGGHAFHFTSEKEFGPAFSEKYKNVIPDKYNVLDMKVKVKTGENFKDALLVFSIETKGKIREWKGEKFSNYQHTDNEWFTVYLSVNFADISKSVPENSVIKVYVWNREKQDFFIDDLEVSSRKGNPVYYGLWRNIY